MTDVVKVARSRLAELEAETMKLKGFLSTAECLLTIDPSESVDILGGVAEQPEMDEVRSPKSETAKSAGSDAADDDDGEMRLGEQTTQGMMPPPLREVPKGDPNRGNIFRRLRT